MTSIEQSRAIYERQVRDNPSNARFQDDLTWTLDQIGVIQNDTGRPVEALASYKQALVIKERLARDNPSNIPFQNNLAQSYLNVGVMTDQPEEALAWFEKCHTIRERLARENPSVTDFRAGLGWSYENLGATQKRLNRMSEAMESLEQARKIKEQVARDNPSVTQFQFDLAWNYDHTGFVHNAMGRAAEAMASFEQARVILVVLTREHPESPEFTHLLGNVLGKMAGIDLDREQFAPAREELRKAVEWQRKSLATRPNNPDYRQSLDDHLSDLVRASHGLGRAEEAAEARRELDAFRDSDPQVVALDSRLAAVLKGGEIPKDDAERLRLAYRAKEKALHASSARLYAEALANHPTPGGDRDAQHRYIAACAAALSGCARGKDDPMPDDPSRARLRTQARVWLQAELAAWAEVLDAGPADMKAKIAPALQRWKDDPDLACIRDDAELAKLPEGERAAFKTLWNDVDQLLTRAAASP